jgi:hypothetical protein
MELTNIQQTIAKPEHCVEDRPDYEKIRISEVKGGPERQKGT